MFVHFKFCFRQWLITHFMQDLHQEHFETLKKLYVVTEQLTQSRLNRRQDRNQVRTLWRERSELTELVLSVVSKDAEGFFTTVLDADTRLPQQFQNYLSKLVSQA